MKAAVLEGDPKIPNLVAVSYYDQKQVQFLSTICESIKWIQCEKPVFCIETEHVENMKFLCLNINDDYNHDMGGCDIVDQLRNYYRFDHWMRKRKWWWSFFFWATGVLLVNTYLLQDIHDLQGDAANDTLRILQCNCTCLAGPFQALAQQVEKSKQEWSIINNNIRE